MLNDKEWKHIYKKSEKLAAENTKKEMCDNGVIFRWYGLKSKSSKDSFIPIRQYPSLLYRITKIARIDIMRRYPFYKLWYTNAAVLDYYIKNDTTKPWLRYK